MSTPLSLAIIGLATGSIGQETHTHNLKTRWIQGPAQLNIKVDTIKMLLTGVAIMTIAEP